MERIEPLDLGRVIFVCDRGMVSEENLKLLSESGVSYLVGMKLRGNAQVREKVLTRRGRYQKVADNLEVKEVVLSSRRYIVCFNPQEAKRDAAYRENLMAHLEEEIEKVNRGSASACSLMGHPMKKRLMRKMKGGRYKLSKEALREESRYDGKYVLLTTDITLSAAELAMQYKNLWEVENAFKALKHRIRIRPMHHWTDVRICAHVSLCVLSYFIGRYAEIKTGKSWEKIRSELDRLMAIKILLKNGTVVKRSQLSKRQNLLYRQLDIESPPLILGQ